MYKPLILLVLVFVYMVGFHGMDLSVNVLLISPETFDNSVDCSLLFCRDYRSIYTQSNFLMFCAFWIAALLNFLPDRVKGFDQNPQKADSQGCENERSEKPKAAVKGHESEEKGYV